MMFLFKIILVYIDNVQCKKNKQKEMKNYIFISGKRITGWLSCLIISVAQQTSARDYSSILTEVCATMAGGKPLKTFLHEKYCSF